MPAINYSTILGSRLEPHPPLFFQKILGRTLTALLQGDVQAAASKPFPKTHCVLVRTLLGFLFMYSGCGTYNQATPRLLNVCVTSCDKLLATNSE